MFWGGATQVTFLRDTGVLNRVGNDVLGRSPRAETVYLRELGQAVDLALSVAGQAR